jgi:hypothetical protein
MNISDLETAGGFVSDAGEKRAIKWNGKDADVFVRRVSFGRIAATQSMPEAERNMALVRECIRLGDDGSEQLTAAQVERLAPALAAAFLNAIAEVNALGEGAADPLD